MGSPTKSKELKLIGIGALTFLAIVLGLHWAFTYTGLPLWAARYLLLTLPLVSFAVGYRVLALQQRTWSLFVWMMGDDEAPGFAVVVTLSAIKGMLVSAAIDLDSLLLVLLLQ